MPEQTTSALEIVRRLMAAMEGLSDRNPLMQTLEHEEPWGGTEEYERESGLTIGDLRALCTAIDASERIRDALEEWHAAWRDMPEYGHATEQQHHRFERAEAELRALVSPREVVTCATKS